MIELGLLSTRIFLAQVTLKIGQENIDIDSVLKANPWTSKIKYLNGGKNNRKLL